MIPWDIVKKYAVINGLDPNLVAAFIMTESSGNPQATRFEPGWKYFLNPALFSDDTDLEKQQQATSWGLMQVMGTIARELGYSGDLTALAQPDLGVKYGCLKLKQLAGKYAGQSDMIAAYNAGSPRRLDDGEYTNQKYVDTVLGYFVKFQQDQQQT